MAQQKNGTLWRVLGIIVSLVVIGAAIVTSYASLGKDVESNAKEITGVKDGLKDYLWPEVKLNTNHRMRDDVDTPYIKQDVAEIKTRIKAMETVQQEILREVQK